MSNEVHFAIHHKLHINRKDNKILKIVVRYYLTLRHPVANITEIFLLVLLMGYGEVSVSLKVF